MIKNSFDLQAEINAPEPYTALCGEYVLALTEAKTYFTDGGFMHSFVQVSAGNKVIDGSAAHISVRLGEDPGGGLSVFSVTESACGLTFYRMSMDITYGGKASGSTVYGFNNHSCGLTVKDCKMDFSAKNQISYTAIHNDGKLDTNMETSADRLMVSGNHITANQNAADITVESTLCGIDNTFANSASIFQNNIFVKNVGKGAAQQAIGVRNSGWYMRLENNNIKANGSHSNGDVLEQSHTYGVYNTGNYMLFTGNNCVGEWGGKCVGLYNSGRFSNITGNKILATHTIMGRSVVIATERNILSGNIITNTSRNPHFIDVFNSKNVITNNCINGLMSMEELRSGCGIFLMGEEDSKIEDCIISNNIFDDIKDFGIVLINTHTNIIQGNHLGNVNKAERYTPIYAKNSDDKIYGNTYVPNRNADTNDSELEKKLQRNYDRAVHSIV